MRTKLVVSIIFLSLSLACQSSAKSRIKNLEGIKIGMDKAEVLETTGFGPVLSERKSGQDRWLFEVYPDRHASLTEQREVRFQDGKVVYTGEVQKPAISAAEQDRLNATAKNDNVNIDAEMKRESRKNSVDLKAEIAKDMPAKPQFEEVVPVGEPTQQ